MTLRWLCDCLTEFLFLSWSFLGASVEFWFFADVLCSLTLFKLKTKKKNKQKTSPQSNTETQILTYPRLAESGFEQTGPGSLIMSVVDSVSQQLMRAAPRAIS